MHIELRSDTFTKPTPGMLAAMMGAKVGDDVFEEDGPTKNLEQNAADRFGFEAGLFCVSGTMANQIAINCHVRQGEEVICDRLSHIYLYEGGGIAANSLASVQLLEGNRGRLSAHQIQNAIQPDNIHHPVSRLVSLENTVNKGGGAIYDHKELLEIQKVCLQNGLALHLDGARIFNALIETGTDSKSYGAIFDSISVCLSKGLGAPMGSVLMGSADFIKKARRVRKRLGGGWRQSGFMAAAGLFALENQVERLKEDHIRAREIGLILQARPEISSLLPIETNIVIAELANGISSGEFVRKLESHQIKTAPFGPNQVRLVTHLDFTDEHLSEFEKRVKRMD